MSRKHPRTQQEIGSRVTHPTGAGQGDRKAPLTVPALHWESERKERGKGEREGNLESHQRRAEFHNGGDMVLFIDLRGS